VGGMENLPLVSVIITTKNEEKNIANCLQSIKEQSYPLCEMIVVDNNSADSTLRIAKTFTGKVFTRGPERSAQRNYGVKQAKGKYILYLDADMILSRGVVSECVDSCEKNSNIALYVPEEIVGHGYWIKVRNFERGFYNATYIDAVRFVQRDKFLKVGGFDEMDLGSGPEDWDFDRRIRQIGDVGIIKSCLYHNEGEFSIKGYLKKKNYYSRSLDGYSNKWGKNDPIVKKQLGAYYRLVGVFVENGKWKRLIRRPLLTIGLYYLRFLVGVTYARHRS
jgi:glycosyltransferase involved in cell wall biosynthesis